ncbi:MAG: class I SAM-dependent methyltransferase [Spirochaetales bacterium]|nr:class I SAM-dependent methyltransferase [Spirochaetales bacterium]
MKSSPSIRCPLCNATNLKCITRQSEYKNWQCLDCCLIFLWPFPREKELEKLYSGEFHLNPENERSNREKVRGFNRILSVIKTFQSGGKLLDVGCSSGIFLHCAKQQGYDVYGIDVGKEAVERAKSYYGLKNVKQGILEDVDSRESFDIITMLDLIEHLPDPLSTLKRSLRLLKKDGYLVLLTPNASGFVSVLTRILLAKPFGMWDHPEPPYHLYQFSHKVLTSYLNSIGFEIVKSVYHEIPVKYAAERFYYTLVEILRVFKRKICGEKKIKDFKNQAVLKVSSQPDKRFRKVSILKKVMHGGLILFSRIFMNCIYVPGRLFQKGNNSLLILRSKSAFTGE